MQYLTVVAVVLVGLFCQQAYSAVSYLISLISTRTFNNCLWITPILSNPLLPPTTVSEACQSHCTADHRRAGHSRQHHIRPGVLQWTHARLDHYRRINARPPRIPHSRAGQHRRRMCLHWLPFQPGKCEWNILIIYFACFNATTFASGIQLWCFLLIHSCIYLSPLYLCSTPTEAVMLRCDTSEIWATFWPTSKALSRPLSRTTWFRWWDPTASSAGLWWRTPSLMTTDRAVTWSRPRLETPEHVSLAVSSD